MSFDCRIILKKCIEFLDCFSVLFLDSDDWLEGRALEILKGNMDGEDMVCFSGRRYFESEGKYLPADLLKEQSYLTGMDYYNDNALLPRDFAFVCVVLRAYKRSFLLDNALRFKEGIYHEDNLFTPLACYYAKNVRTVNECLYDYRIRPESITTTYNPKRLKDMIGTANELAMFFVPKTGFDKTIVYRAITHYYQVVFQKAPRREIKDFNKLCDWKLYRTISRTKPRHKLNFIKNRLKCHF